MEVLTLDSVIWDFWTVNEKAGYSTIIILKLKYRSKISNKKSMYPREIRTQKHKVYSKCQKLSAEKNTSTALCTDGVSQYCALNS